MQVTKNQIAMPVWTKKTKNPLIAEDMVQALATNTKHNICAVKWYDNRAVTLVSSFAGPEPVQEIQRWDKATKTYIDVERPYIVGTYNKFMGGVDLLDSFTAKYKYALKSRRWYMYIFWHTITLAVVNAWLLYRRHCQALRMPKKEILNMRKFQAQLASSLILVIIYFCYLPCL
jgi:hypothetical protein